MEKDEERDCAPSAPPCQELPCTAPPYRPEEETWVSQCRRARLLSAQWMDCGVLCLTVLSLVLCLVFYFICPNCLFAVLLFCAILCPCIHPLNAPLWLAIILLTVSGWSFTVGSFSVAWIAKSH